MQQKIGNTYGNIIIRRIHNDKNNTLRDFFKN